LLSLGPAAAPEVTGRTVFDTRPGPDYKRPVPTAVNLWNRFVFATAAMAITVLPERVKSHDRLQPYVSTVAHVLSAYVEVVLATGLFVWGMISWVSRFSHGAGWTYLTSQPGLGYNDFFAVGALGYLSYLFRPTTWLILYCFAEGIVRALEAAFWDRPVGLGVVSVGWRVATWAHSSARRRPLATLIGPPRPDEIVLPTQSRRGLLEIYSVEEKPWSDYQEVELDEEFYQLATRQVVPHGPHHAWRYQLHRMEPSDVLRGAIVRLPMPPAAAADKERARTPSGTGPEDLTPSEPTRPGSPAHDR
jgi:hypothetical protein